MSHLLCVLVTAATPPGSVDIHGFSATGPLPGLPLTLDTEQLFTDEHGVAHWQGPAGVYTLRAGPARHQSSAQVPVVAGGLTDVIVTVSADAVHIDVEAPDAPTAADPVAVEQLPAASTGGVLRGTVVGLPNGTPVQGAWVLVRGLAQETQTDAQGVFALVVPAGPTQVSVVHPEYLATVAPAVNVPPGGETSMRVELARAVTELDALTITAPRIVVVAPRPAPAEALAAPPRLVLTDSLAASDASRSGDADAAAALKRVTGVSIVGGRYVYVRGLGERYSGTLLNGAPLPSPEPERRVVPLDIFPTGVLDGMDIHKTYSPDQPAEFGGGTVDLHTRAVPQDFTLQLNVSSTARTGTTFMQGLSHQGGALDFLGVDDGSRGLPSAVANASADQPLLERDQFSRRGYTAAQLEELGEKMPNRWNVSRAMVLPDASGSAILGHRLRLGPLTIGALAAGSWSQAYFRSWRQRNFYLLGGGGKLELAHAYREESLKRSVDAGGMLATGVQWGEHQVTYTQLLSRNTEDEARVYQGINRDVASTIRVTRLQWVERQLWAHQVAGVHGFGAFGAQLRWRYTYAQASRYEPDRREVRFDREEGSKRWLLSDRPEGNQRLYSSLLEHSHDLGVDARLPLPWLWGLKATVQTGTMINWRRRSVETRRYKFQHKGPASGDSSIITQSPEDIFTPQNIGPQGFQFEEVTRETDNYTASQLLVAGYAKADVPISPAWTFSGGVRVEHARMQVSTFELFSPSGKPVDARVENTDVLPGATLSFQALPTLVLQASAALTVSRPDFRELSPATYNDVTGGRMVFGNPDLQRARIGSGELRWDWQLPRGSKLGGALFYKHFDQPIERVVQVGAQLSTTYANAKSADNAGVELEWLLRGGLVHSSLQSWVVGGNAALIRSTVTLPDQGIQTSKTRPLEGQSPYVGNLQFGYDNPDNQVSIMVLYNVAGPRISEAGALGAPDVYEQPFHQIDVVAGIRLPVGLLVRLKAQNLMDPSVRYTQGGQVVDTWRKGRSFTVSVGL